MNRWYLVTLHHGPTYLLMEKLSLFVNHESFLLRHILVIIGVTMSLWVVNYTEDHRVGGVSMGTPHANGREQIDITFLLYTILCI